MKFTREAPTAVTITSVSTEEIRIGAERWATTVALTGERVLGDFDDKPIARLTRDDFAELLATEPELIVLGTGREHVIPPRELVFAMARAGVGLEVMQTRAAARTFNVLSGEGRRVAAVLYL